MPRTRIEGGVQNPVSEFPLSPITQFTAMDVRSLAGTFDMALRQLFIATEFNHGRIDDRVQEYRARAEAASRRVDDYKKILRMLGQASLVTAIERSVREEHMK